MIRVTYLIASEGIYGAERYVQRLSRGLRARGDFDTNILVFGGPVLRPEWQVFSDSSGVEVTHLASLGRPTSHSLPALLARLRDLKPQIVHSNLPRSDFFASIAQLALRYRLVVTHHSWEARYQTLKGRAAARFVANVAARQIVPSLYLASFMSSITGKAPGSFTYIPHGTEILKSRPESGPTEEPLVGITGRIVSGKGHFDLIDAVSRLGSNWSIRVIGDGPDRGELRDHARARDVKLDITGWLVEPSAAIAGCTIVAAPTREELGEGFGYAVLEAMALGKPTVVTSAGALPELVSGLPSNIVAHPSDPKDLARALEWAFVERARLAVECYEKAHQFYSSDLMVTRVAGTYRRMLHE